MQKCRFTCFVLFLFWQPFFIAAQTNSVAGKTLREQRERFIRQLKGISSDTNINYPVIRFLQSETDNIYTFIASDAFMTPAEKDKATWSLVYFMQQLEKALLQQKMGIYDIPAAMQAFKNTLKAITHDSSPGEELKELSQVQSDLISAAFFQYKEYPLFDDIAVYKRLSSSPEFILQFLESKPGFRFTDSLLLIAAAYDPYKIVSYLKQGKPALQERIRTSANIYVQQIVSIAGQRNTSELMPFVVELAENKTTQEEIMQKRSEITAYFQLLLSTLDGSVSSHGPAFIFQKILRNGIKEKSLYFFANHINEFHSASDAVRFAPVKTLTPKEIYYIITSCSDELYTSSYLGLYKRLMAHFKTGSADSLFQLVHYDNFRVFMRMAANYNVLADFLGRMSRESASLLLKRFISGIESDPATGLEKAMDIADSFIGLDSAADVAGMIQKELHSNLDRCTSGRQYFGMRLYGILLPVFEMVVKKDSLNDLWQKLGNYESLQRSALQNKDGQIIQMVLFYGDEDGVASFNNFQKLFMDTSKWQITNNESWVTVRSLTGQPVILYANLPLDNEEEMDLKAQDALVAYLKQQAIEPTVLIHRGHSYHLGNTLKRLRPSVKLAILGSCGSYNNAISIAAVNPDVQIIGSKKTGTKSINDPIIDVINETLQNKEVLSWNEVWEKLRTRFSNDEATLNLFNEYIPPVKNVSLFVLKLFNFYSKPAVSSSVALSQVK